MEAPRANQSLSERSGEVPTITILRHGQALHNVDRKYTYPNPPLTELGKQQAQSVKLAVVPDLIVASPMTRTIQTTLLVIGELPPRLNNSVQPEIQIWPDLREAHDAICNKGIARAKLSAEFPQLDLSECPDEWNYLPHTHNDAMDRAERVRRRLVEASKTKKNILVVSHRGFIAYLVKGSRFDVCDHRQFRFAAVAESDKERVGVHTDLNQAHDFGPTVLVPL